jgi:uncharacterized protein (TIRG00374 family)
VSKVLVLVAKASITGLIVWLLLDRVDLAPVGAFLKTGAAVRALSMCCVLLIVQAVMAAMRIRLIMRLLNEDLSIGFGFSTWMIGLLFGQVLVTFVAGDAVRIWQIARKGYRRRTAATAVFLERALGFAVLMAMVVPAAFYLLAYAGHGATRTSLLVVLLACVAGVACFVGSGFIQRIAAVIAPKLHAQRLLSAVVDVSSGARHLAADWRLSSAIVGLSAAMHLCNVLAFYVLLTALGVDIGHAANAAVSLTAMLLSLLPIALAGWGVREGVAVVGYGLFGVTSQAALTASVGFGLSLLFTCLIGVPYVLAAKRQAPLTDTNEDQDRIQRQHA